MQMRVPSWVDMSRGLVSTLEHARIRPLTVSFGYGTGVSDSEREASEQCEHTSLCLVNFRYIGINNILGFLPTWGLSGRFVGVRASSNFDKASCA